MDTTAFKRQTQVICEKKKEKKSKSIFIRLNITDVFRNQFPFHSQIFDMKVWTWRFLFISEQIALCIDIVTLHKASNTQMDRQMD